MAAKLRAIGLDVSYHRARGDRIHYRDAGGQEVEVLDLMGGFGTAFFGHNHPELVARAVELLQGDRPFHAQASMRGPAGRLGRRLSGLAERATGRPYVAHFANSGAEAVEAAIKHAEMERRGRVDDILHRLGQRHHEIRRRLREHTAYLPDALFTEAARLFGLAQVASVDDLYLRLFHRALEELDRPPTFLALEGAFHGKTSGSLKLTHRAEYQAPWRSIGPSCCFLLAGDLEGLQGALERSTVQYMDLDVAADGAVLLVPRSFVNVAACFVEPIQGEGGVREIEHDYLRALRRAADEHGFPLVFDEIQSGMGRTGRFFAAEHAGVTGDYYILAKALGGGIAKISAVLVAREHYLEEFGFLHTSTFADDDFSCELALVALDLLERDDGALTRRAAEIGAYLIERLRVLMARYPDQIRDVRGRGLMVGAELASQQDSPSPLMRVVAEQDLLGFLVSGWFLREKQIRIAPTLSARATIRLVPSAYIQQADVDRFCAGLEELLDLLRAGDAYRLVRFVVGRAGEETARAAPKVRPVRARTGEPGAARVGFLTHFLTSADLLDWDPALAPLRPADCDRFLERTRGMLEPFVAARTGLRSALGTRVDATVIGLPFTPPRVVEAMRAGGGDWARDLIDQGVELARRFGCAVVGFGGFTSILTHNCRSIVTSDVALTTGNSLTAAAALEAAQLAARRLGIGRSVLGVVGAAGNIGRVLAEVASDWADEIVLLGRPGAERRLRDAAAALYGSAARRAGIMPATGLARTMADRGILGAATDAALELGDRGPVRIATDLAALRGCNLILTASNAARPIVQPGHITPDRPVVVCDVAVPRDVDDRVMTERPNAVVLKGGVVRAPMGQTFAIDGMNLPPGEIYGCLAETLLLGLAGIGEDFSYGALDPMRIRRIRDQALMHGFTLDENRRMPATE
jgi:acetylornithine/succinyldiaminopimelate/putrescine aminotransferase/predicted amino acid dehydrogenase